MVFLEFQKFSFNHIFFLCYFISSFIRKRIQDLLFDKKGQISGDFYKVYTQNISHFLTTIPLLIKNYLFKNSNNNIIIILSHTQYIYHHDLLLFYSNVHEI